MAWRLYTVVISVNYREIKDQFYVCRIMISNFGFPPVTKQDDYFTCTIIIADEQNLVNDKLTHNNADERPHALEHPVVVITADVIAATAAAQDMVLLDYLLPPTAQLRVGQDSGETYVRRADDSGEIARQTG